MNSPFGSKRKARKIQVDEDEDDVTSTAASSKPTRLSTPPSNVTRKPFKKSSLRQSIAFDEEEDSTGSETTWVGHRTSQKNGQADVSKSSIGGSSSLIKKKKTVSSRLSFGPGEVISGDAAEALEDDELFTTKKPAPGKKKFELPGLRKSLPAYQIPTRGGDDDEERPTYSKDYLNELRSSTPSTPKDLQSFSATVDDDEGLDESELEGAMIVESDMDAVSASLIPSEAEIREKKARRARLAHESDFISLDSPADDSQQISLLPRKSKTETRLVREDEEIAEGFDEFVDDGRISLGKKAEREAKRRQRAQMAEMIHDAEGSSSDPSDDSEAERTAAYEAAQTRAGMDGLAKPHTLLAAAMVPPKVTPLLSLSEALGRLRTTMGTMEGELAKRVQKMDELKREKSEILEREVEVQRLLKEAGERYSAMRGPMGPVSDDHSGVFMAQNGFGEMMGVTRGLESFGNTPVGRPEVEDVG